MLFLRFSVFGAVFSSAVPIAMTTAVVLVPLHAEATVMVRRTVNQMTAISELVIVASVQRTTALWVNQRIYTDVETTVDAVIRGTTVPGNTVVIRTPGGIVRDTGQHLAGAPSLQPGERYVFFLRRSRSGSFETIGLSQGALPVRDVSPPAAQAGTWVFPAMTQGLELVDPTDVQSGTSVVIPAQGMPLDAFMQTLRER